MRNYLITLRVLSFFSLLGTLWAFDELKFGLDMSSLAEEAIVSFDGYVKTSENWPISGVAVSKNGVDIAKTNKHGFFVIEKRTVLELSDVLRFEHPSFVTTTKVLRSDSKLIIWMKKRGEATVFHSRRDQTIALEKGGHVNIPSDAFTLYGKPYAGSVEIRASYIDVTDRNEVRSAPGRYVAYDERRNELVPLNSFGMIEITAVVPRKNTPLELVEDRAIAVAFPILAESTTDRVNLYEFNAEKGVWVLEGSLQNIDNTLQGEITSVNSAWNADKPCSQALVCVEVEVLYQSGYLGCGVGATGLTYQGFDGIHSPGPDNHVELMVCRDSVFELGACWLLCCVPGVPLSDPCCNNPQYRTTIDMGIITLATSGCTDIGTWVVPN